MAMVEVKPLPLKKWHGKTGKESFAVPKAVEVLYDPDLGKYATGLTPEEAEEYGRKMGVDLSDTFNPNEPHPYWATKPAAIPLLNSTMIFNTEKPADFVKVKNMKASKMVASSLKAWEEGHYPNATHVIYDEEESITLRAEKIAMKNEAVKFALKMSLESKTSVVQIFSKKTVRGRSQDFIEVEFDQILTDMPDKFLELVKMGPEEVKTRGAVEEAIYRNILQKEVSGIYYMGEFMALDEDGAVKWFRDPRNDKMKVTIMQKLNS